MQSNNKTIAKNTLFLYFRMMFTMVVSLFTSRVILQKLGVDDYGIYQAVGGIVGFMSFINGALATGSSRFLTFALGEGNKEKLRKTFSTTLNVHILLAMGIAVIAETVGIWFLENKLIIPASSRRNNGQTAKCVEKAACCCRKPPPARRTGGVRVTAGCRGSWPSGPG